MTIVIDYNLFYKLNNNIHNNYFKFRANFLRKKRLKSVAQITKKGEKEGVKAIVALNINTYVLIHMNSIWEN